MVEEKAVHVHSYPFTDNMSEEIVQKNLFRCSVPITHCQLLELDEFQSLLFTSSSGQDITITPLDSLNDYEKVGVTKSIKTNDMGIRHFSVHAVSKEKFYVAFIDNNNSYSIVSCHMSNAGTLTQDVAMFAACPTNSSIVRDTSMGCHLAWNPKSAFGKSIIV